MNYGKVEGPSSSRRRYPSTTRFAATSAILTVTLSRSDRALISRKALPRGHDGTHRVALRRLASMETQAMDWKRLVQFVLQGSSDLEQYAILLIRVSIGLFFAISGANKRFVAGGTKPVYDTLVQAKVPFPRQTAYFVSGVEFVGGSLLTLGFLSSVACVAL